MRVRTGSNVKSSVCILVDLIDITKGADEDAGDTSVSVSGCCMQRRVSVIVFEVRLAARHEQDSGRAVVTLLTREVQSREAALVLEVRIRLVLHQHFHRLSVPFPCRLV